MLTTIYKYIIVLIKNNITNFLQFIKDNSVAKIALGTLIGIQVNGFAQNVTNFILIPIINWIKYIFLKIVTFNTYAGQPTNVDKLNLSNILSTVIQPLLVIFIIFFMWKFTTFDLKTIMSHIPLINQLKDYSPIEE